MNILLLGGDCVAVQTFNRLQEQVVFRQAREQREAFELLGSGGWDLVLVDAEFSGAGLEILARIRCGADAPPVALVAERVSMDGTLEALDLGAHAVLAKPLGVEALREIISTLPAAGAGRPLLAKPHPEGAIIGSSPAMLAVFNTLGRAARSDATVLVLGESGTGKEMTARALHGRSARNEEPFVAINCAAIPENLLESELFGHEKGAFTGAIARRIGRFERASGGTLFLDEIGDMSLSLQSKILRALQEREIERVGGASPVRVDVRVIAATNHNLAESVRQGRFREDLFYRLAVVTLGLPPLRERGADLELLAEQFVAVFALAYARPIRAVAEDVWKRLYACSWPGNVRQLRNAMERAVVMADGDTLLPCHLPPEIRDPPRPERSSTHDDGAVCTLSEMERRLIVRALRESGNNISVAARTLGIHRNTLHRKMVEHALDGV